MPKFAPSGSNDRRREAGVGHVSWPLTSDSCWDRQTGSKERLATFGSGRQGRKPLSWIEHLGPFPPETVEEAGRTKPTFAQANPRGVGIGPPGIDPPVVKGGGSRVRLSRDDSVKCAPRVLPHESDIYVYIYIYIFMSRFFEIWCSKNDGVFAAI